MKSRLFMALAVMSVVIAGCSGSSDSDRAVPQRPATNPDGSPTTGVITANFNPAESVIPFPNNLLLSGTTDLTLNIPGADPNDFGNPLTALNSLDGFSTTQPWSTGFSAALDPSSVIPGSNVRVFEVQLVQGSIAVAGVNRELVPGQEYIATVAPSDPSGRTLAIVPLVPLQQMTAYMAVLTNTLTDQQGNPATPSQAYFIAQRTSPLVTSGGVSTDPLLDNATANALEPLRQIINTHEAAASAAGVSRGDIVLSWTLTTQSITPVLSVVQSLAQPADHQIVRACPAPQVCLTTADVLPPGASPGIADLYIGVITLPYYLGVPDGPDFTPALTRFWQASPGAYIPPFDGFGLDPDSTHITVANPIPVVRDMQTVPVLMSVPNAASGQTRPAAGWPVVIYQHGITRNRSDMLALADTLASVGFAVIAMDMPLHGITQTDPADPAQPLAGLYIGNTPFAPVANERTFDIDANGDGVIDASGSYFINLQSLLTSRDNLRQSQADLGVLAKTVPNIDFTGDGTADFDGSRISFVGSSLGAMAGIPFLAVEDSVNNGVLSAPGGGIVNFMVASESFGPVILAGLQQAGLEPGSPDFFQFLLVAQTVIDAADPINWGSTTVLTNSVLLHQVAGDSVIPNAVAGAPLSGTEPLIRIMGLAPIVQTTQDPMGIRGATRFNQGHHGSLLDPSGAPAVTAEMQGQMASMIATGGTTVVVANDAVIQID